MLLKNLSDITYFILNRAKLTLMVKFIFYILTIKNNFGVDGRIDGGMDGGMDAGWMVSKILERDGDGRWTGWRRKVDGMATEGGRDGDGS